MCTSFIKKTDHHCYIGMNFDNDGMSYFIDTKKKDWFFVSVLINQIKRPSFGVHKSGIFFNNLMVEPNELGKYRRGKGVVHTSRLLSEIINGKILVDELEEYLSQTEIVNVPDYSTHQMICDTKGDVWIIEPGIGKLHQPLENGEFQLMTNTSLLNHINKEEAPICPRYAIAKELLSSTAPFDTAAALEILKAVQQSEGEWTTAISMVYDKTKQTISYCTDREFDHIEHFTFGL